MTIQEKQKLHEQVRLRSQQQYNGEPPRSGPAPGTGTGYIPNRPTPVSALPSPVSVSQQIIHADVRPSPSPSLSLVPDELVLEITTSSASATIVLRPAEVSRMRGRYGRGPGFEKWVGERVRDMIISFGGG